MGRQAMPQRRRWTWQGKLERTDGAHIGRPWELTEHAAWIFEDQYRSFPGQDAPAWVRPRRQEHDLARVGKIDAPRIRALVMKLKVGKTCSADDRIVGEMLQAAPLAVCSVLTELFSLRIRNCTTCGFDYLFDWHEIVLVGKMLRRTAIRSWRPIAVLSVLCKLYSMLLTELCRLRDVDVAPNQYALRSCSQSLESKFAIRQLV